MTRVPPPVTRGAAVSSMRRALLLLPWLLALPVRGQSAAAIDDRAAPEDPAPLVAVEAPGRLVAIGDLHGDLAATRRVLRLVGAIDEEDAWVGGSLTVVQVGDQIDRGPDERQVLDFLAALEMQAREDGGALHILNGNHEVMNVQADFRYVPDGGWAAFDEFADAPLPAGADLDDVPPEQRGRHAAFHPGGPYAMRLSERDVVLVVDDTLFVHGGVLPELVDYGLARVNAETRAWMRGERERPAVLTGEASPVWSRHYSSDTGPDDCALLEEVLERLSLRRMVVAHTVQAEGITAACSDRVWRVDVGLSAHYGGPTEALEITADGVRVLR